MKKTVALATTLAVACGTAPAFAQDADTPVPVSTVGYSTVVQPQVADTGTIIGATVGSILGAALIGLIGWIIYATTMPGM